MGKRVMIMLWELHVIVLTTNLESDLLNNKVVQYPGNLRLCRVVCFFVH